ncbi:MAG: tetratricopeptide repeat protein [Candidatus Jettenia sp.]|nr:MAG: tetratricopeptide repeat protein [Candidatus Jettenia sp.]
MRCFFPNPGNVVLGIIAFLCIGLLGCNSITARQDAQPLAGNKNQPLDVQEKTYSYFCTGYFYMLERNWEDAARYFEKALQLDNSSEKILRHLATCYFQLGKNEKAVNFIKKLAEMKPHEFNVHYTLATLYEIGGKYQDAIAEYENARRCKITKLDHVFLADTLYRLANLYMQEGMMEKGAECYKSMLDMKLVNEPAKIYYEIGRRYFEKNDIKNALEYFLLVKKVDPNLNFANFYLTLCYDALNDYSHAINEGKAFLEKEPDNWIMHFALSDIYRKIHDESKRNEEIEKTQEILRKNVDAGSKNPKEYFLLSQIYRSQHRIGKAIAVIENMKLIPLDKETNRDAHFLLANLYYERQEFDRVEEELYMTVKLDPDFHEANNFLGYLFVENNKNLDEAILLISKALKVQPKNGAYLDSLGWAYYKKAQKEKKDNYLVMALEKLREAVQFAEEPDIYEHMGDVYYSLGHWDEAIKAFEKAKILYKEIFNHEAKLKNITAKLEKIRRLISLEETTLKVTLNHREVENSNQP